MKNEKIERQRGVSMTGKLKVGDAAPSIQVMDADGNTMALSSVWSDRPVVLAFLRHFG